MNLRFVFALVFFATVLTACIAPVPPGANGAPARLILDPLVTRRNASAGILAVRRDPTTVGAECRHRIFLDGNPVADLRPNEVINIYATPGDHVLRAEETGLSCHGGNELAATSERGKWHSFRTAPVSPGGMLLSSTTQ
jgi:hypothetical protein